VLKGERERERERERAIERKRFTWDFHWKKYHGDQRYYGGGQTFDHLRMLTSPSTNCLGYFSFIKRILEKKKRSSNIEGKFWYARARKKPLTWVVRWYRMSNDEAVTLGWWYIANIIQNGIDSWSCTSGRGIKRKCNKMTTNADNAMVVMVML